MENSTLKQLDLKDAYIQITVQHSNILDLLGQIIGWIYFFSWSTSPYPQVFKNWKRKSVVGLNLDFVALDFVGFGLYSFFNVAFYWVKPIQSAYFSRHPQGYIYIRLTLIFQIDIKNQISSGLQAKNHNQITKIQSMYDSH